MLFFSFISLSIEFMCIIKGLPVINELNWSKNQSVKQSISNASKKSIVD